MADRASGEIAINDSSYADELQGQADSLETDTRKKVVTNGYFSLNIVLLEEDKRKIRKKCKTCNENYK